MPVASGVTNLWRNWLKMPCRWSIHLAMAYGLMAFELRLLNLDPIRNERNPVAPEERADAEAPPAKRLASISTPA